MNKAITLSILVLALSQTASPDPFSGSAAGQNTANDPRGKSRINVPRLKRFDEIDLERMLLSLESQLQAIKTISGDSVTTAVGTLQGARARDNFSSFRAEGPPAIIKNDHQGLKNDTEVKVPEAKIPTADNRVQKDPLSTGLSGASLLDSQVSLGFKIQNLRMVLRQALSDRYRIQPHEGVTRRGSVVFGTEISIDPSSMDADKVAEVEVTITGDRGGPVSVVGMYPREEGYNVAALKRSSQSIGLGAVVNLIGLSFANERNNQALFVVQDRDVVALERRSPTPNSVRCVWQFRPVLDEKTVRPGKRPVFIQLALPEGVSSDWTGKVTVETIWRRFDYKTKAAGEVLDRHFEAVNEPVSVQSIEPRAIHGVSQDLGGGNMRVSLVGGNLLDEGTDIMLGQRSVRDMPDNGLVFSGGKDVSFILPAASLFDSDLYLRGRSGEYRKIPVVIPQAKTQVNEFGNLESQFEVQDVYAEPAAESASATDPDWLVNLYLKPKVGGLPATPVVKIGSRVYGTQQYPFEEDPKAGNQLGTPPGGATHYVMRVPSSILLASRRLSVKDLVWGASAPAAVRNIPLLRKDALTVRTVRVHKTTKDARVYTVEGSGFPKLTTAMVGTSRIVAVEKPADLAPPTKPSLLRLGANVLLLSVPRSESLSSVVLLPGDYANAPALVVDLPMDAGSPDAAGLVPLPVSVETLVEGTGEPLKVFGPSLSRVVKIAFKGKPLNFTSSDDGQAVQIVLPSEVINKADDYELDVFLDNDRKAKISFRVIAKSEGSART
jgi:hypothetical protein